MELREKRLASEYVFRGKILNVRVDKVRLPNGRTSSREVVEYAGAVAVVAVDDQDRVVLVRQYRYPVGKELLEIPAGKLEPNEAPLECARRELLEETGYSAREWRLLLTYYSTPGFTSEKLHLFLARGLEKGPSATDPDEFVEVETVPLACLPQLIADGEVCDGKSLVGLLSLLAGEQPGGGSFSGGSETLPDPWLNR